MLYDEPKGWFAKVRGVASKLVVGLGLAVLIGIAVLAVRGFWFAANDVDRIPDTDVVAYLHRQIHDASWIECDRSPDARTGAEVDCSVTAAGAQARRVRVTLVEVVPHGDRATTRFAWRWLDPA